MILCVKTTAHGRDVPLRLGEKSMDERGSFLHN